MTEIEDNFSVVKEIDNIDRKFELAWTRIEMGGSTSKRTFEEKFSGTRVFPVINADSLIPVLLDIVHSSKDMICVSSFLIQGSELTDALLSAAKRGVRVYILTAGEEDLKLTDEDGTPSIERVKEFRGLLSSLSDKVFLRTADYHAKFVLTDPKGSSPKGIMTTCNLTKDAMSGFNKEIFVRLTAEEVRSFFDQFLEGLWKMSRHELKGGRLQELHEKKFIPEEPIPLPTHPATMPPLNSLDETIKGMLKEAKKHVTISAWTFSEEVEIPALLSECLDRGLEVTIFARPNYLNGIVLSKLQKKGAKIVAHERFHAKSLVVDGEKSIVTTANFATHGLKDGFETGVLLDTRDTKQLLGILSFWEKECDWALYNSTFEELPSGMIRLLDSTTEDIREIRVLDENLVKLPDLKPTEIKRPAEVDIKYQKPQVQKDLMVKRTKYTCNVIQPQLPKLAKKVEDTNGKFKVFKTESSKNLFVPISTWEELDEARKFATIHNAKVVKSSL